MTMLCRVATGIGGGVLGAAAMAALQFPLRGWLRRKSTPGPLSDSGIGFQAAFRLPEPTSVTAERLFGPSTLTAEHPVASALIMHAGFGASAGLLYALLVPDGAVFTVAFAVVLWLGAAEGVLPIAGLTKPARRSSVAVQALGLGEHILYACLLRQARRACA